MHGKTILNRQAKIAFLAGPRRWICQTKSVTEEAPLSWPSRHDFYSCFSFLGEISAEIHPKSSRFLPFLAVAAREIFRPVQKILVSARRGQKWVGSGSFCYSGRIPSPMVFWGSTQTFLAFSPGAKMPRSAERARFDPGLILVATARVSFGLVCSGQIRAAAKMATFKSFFQKLGKIP